MTSRRAPTAWLALAFAFIALLGGCSAAPDLDIYQVRPIAFNHARHAQEAQLGCGDCHLSGDDGQTVGMPSPRACTTCHKTKEEFEAKLKPFLVEGKVQWTDVTDLIEDVHFDHGPHLKAEVACETCHKGASTSTKVSTNLAVAKEACLDCHAGNKGVDTCKTCHTTIDQRWRPESHEIAWKRLHGQVAREGQVPPYTNDCAMCHSEQTCAECHADEEPQDHTNFWRLRGHGVTARMDRDECSTCHRVDFCIDCHAQTAPKNHIASWGSPQDFHCMSCHLDDGGQSSGCTTCHTGVTSHQEAAPVPDYHGEGRDCRECHGAGAPLPHPDKGDSCVACHL